MKMGSIKKTARLAGVLFLLMVVFGVFAEVMFRQKLFVLTDATATANNILANVFLYRVGIVSDLLMAICYLFTALALYHLFCPVHKNLASLMVLFAAAGSLLLMFNFLIELAPLLILSGEVPLGGFAADARESLAMLFYQLYQHGYMIGQVFFALWVLPLGILILRSDLIPKVFGVLFVVEFVLGFASVFVHFLAPNELVDTLLLLPGTVAEFSFLLWLLICGVKKPKLVT